MADTIEPMPQIDQERLAEQLVEQARAEGVELVGPGGMMTGLTKDVLEAALEAEMSEHLGYDKHDPMGRNRGNSRNWDSPEDCVDRGRPGRDRGAPRPRRFVRAGHREEATTQAGRIRSMFHVCVHHAPPGSSRTMAGTNPS